MDRRWALLLAGVGVGCLQLDTSGPGAGSPSIATQTEGSTADPATSSTTTMPIEATSTSTSASSSGTSSPPASSSGPAVASSSGEQFEWTPFSDPVPIAELNTPADQRSPSMTANRLSLVYVEDTNLLLASRDNAGNPWNPATHNYPAVNNPPPKGAHRAIHSARINGRGNEIHFVRNDLGTFDVLLRDGALPTGWSNLPINSGGGDDVYFSARDSGLEAVFASNRDGDNQLYLASRMSTANDWELTGPIDDANAGGEETSPNLGSLTRLVLFVSDSHSGADKDVYRLAFGDHGPPVIVDELSISGIEEADIWLSPDETTVLLTREGAGGSGDIYIATR